MIVTTLLWQYPNKVSSIEKSNLSLSSIDERINQQTIIAATQIEVNPSGYKIKCNDDASLQAYIGDEGVFHRHLIACNI